MPPLNRRNFVKLMAATGTAASAGWLLSSPAVREETNQESLDSGVLASNVQELAAAFVQPPDDARPWVYWFWMGGNVTRTGITADLESMRQVGIGGVLIMVVENGVPPGPVKFGTNEWRNMFEFACCEAERLGLHINMTNDAGWCGSGGPWVKPELSMQKVVHSEIRVQGGGPLDVLLPRPKSVPDAFVNEMNAVNKWTNQNAAAWIAGETELATAYYADIAVLAFPTPQADQAGHGYRIADIAAKAEESAVQDNMPTRIHYPPLASGQTIPEAGLVDVSQFMDSYGRLKWNPPAGDWTVMRFGHTSTAMENHPSPPSGIGLETDKLSRRATELQFNSLMLRLIKDVGPLAGTGKTLVSTHIDSWESGAQNWTASFRHDFKRLRGYDITPYLPVLAGRVVGNLEISERFLWDFRQTISDLLITNYAACMRELANKHGIRLSIEGYSGVPADELRYGGQANEPMSELWSSPRFMVWNVLAEMTSAGHVYGHRIIGQETFTADGNDRWQNYPAIVKNIGDWAFCQGVNRLVFHRFTMQPWTNPHYYPGTNMGSNGMFYERTNTWWHLTKPWHDYVARCSYMLRQGDFVADVCYMQPEGSPQEFNPQAAAPWQSGCPPVRPDYNFDCCPAEVVLHNMTVKNGMITVPSGMRYRLLVLPPTKTMTAALITKIRSLVNAGATIVGPPPVQSPSLTDYPNGDKVVAQIAAELWGSGKVIANKTPEQVLATRGIPPEFQSDVPLAHIHRQLSDADIYFVAACSGFPVTARCRFRTVYRCVELWNPLTGDIRPAPAYQNKDGVVEMPLQFEPSGSTFVIFRGGPAKVDAVISVTRNGMDHYAGALPHRPKIVIQNATYGPPDDPARTREVTSIVQHLISAADLSPGATFSFPVSEIAAIGGDPAPFVVKTLTIHYSVNGKSQIQMRHDGQQIELVHLPMADGTPTLALEVQSQVIRFLISKPGHYVIVRASGKRTELNISTMPQCLEIAGPWSVTFPAGWGAPAEIQLENLIAWNKYPDAGVRYFSGTAEYQKEFDVPAELMAPDRRIYLELGTVAVNARVTLNGHDMGILWRQPFTIDVTDVLHAGHNQLNIRVTNLWINRMIGDQQLPADSDRAPAGYLVEWPKWLLEGKPSPSGRFTFTTWQLWQKTDPLVESGLMGPVKLQAIRVVDLQ